MAMSTQALKICLHIYNIVFVFLASLAFIIGITAAFTPRTFLNIYNFITSENVDDINEMLVKKLGWNLLTNGLFYLVLTAFGIYAVKTEHAKHTKWFCILHGVGLFLTLLRLLGGVSAFCVGEILFKAGIMCLIYLLYKRFTGEKPAHPLPHVVYVIT